MILKITHILNQNHDFENMFRNFKMFEDVKLFFFEKIFINLKNEKE